MVDSKKKLRKGTGKVAFLAHLEGIKKMIEAGHPTIAVFEEYESKMTVKEQQFGKYVRKYVKGESAKVKETKAETKPKKSEHGLPKFEKKERNRDDLV